MIFGPDEQHSAIRSADPITEDAGVRPPPPVPPNAGRPVGGWRVTFGQVTRSVQRRCPNQADHARPTNDRRFLPIPCPDCYSLIVTSERIPYRPDERWAPVEDTV